MRKKKLLKVILASFAVALFAVLGVSVPSVMKAKTATQDVPTASAGTLLQGFEGLAIEAIDKCSDAKTTTSNKTQGNNANTLKNNAGDAWFRFKITTTADIRAYAYLTFDYTMSGGCDMYLPHNMGANCSSDPVQPASGTMTMSVAAIMAKCQLASDGKSFQVVIAGTEGQYFYIDNLQGHTDNRSVYLQYLEAGVNSSTGAHDVVKISDGSGSVSHDTSSGTNHTLVRFSGRWVRVRIEVDAPAKWFSSFSISIASYLSSDATVTFQGSAKTLANSAWNYPSWGISASGSEIGGGNWDKSDPAWIELVFDTGSSSLTNNSNNYVILADLMGVLKDNVTISVVSEDTNKGTVSSSASGSVLYNTKFDINASPKSGYSFAGWYEGSTKKYDTAYVEELYATGSTTLKATFTANKYTVTLKAQTGGQVSADNSAWGSEKTKSATYNANFKAYAQTNTGYTFLGWYDGDTQISTETTLSLTYKTAGTKTYTAKYKINTYTVTVNKGTGISGVSGGGTYNYGTSVTINATVSTGYTWKNWTGASTQTSQSYTFTLGAANVTYTANATINQYTVTVNKGTGISGVSGGGKYDYGTSVTINATVSDGYTWKNWTGTSTQTSQSYTFTLGAANVTYTANATANTYTVTLKAQTGGQVSADNSAWGSEKTKTATYDANFKAYAKTNTGYTFLGWYDGDTQISTETTLSLTYKTAGKKTYTAKYKINQYTVTVNKGTGISGVSGGGKYDYGTSVTINATVSEGYTWKNWTGASTQTSQSYTFTLGAADVTYTANATINKYTVTVNKGTGISGVSGGGEYKYGTSVTINATVSDGYTWKNWTGASTQTSQSYTFTLGAANVTYTANATANTYKLTITPGTGGKISTDNKTWSSAETKIDVTYNSTVTVYASESSGYDWSNWTGTYTGTSKTLSFTYTTVGNASVTANFTPKTYTVTLKAASNDTKDTYGGQISKTGADGSWVTSTTKTATYNANFKAYAKAKTGFTFAGWYNGDTKIGESTTLSLTYSTAGASTYTAKFEIISYTVTVNTFTNVDTYGQGGTASANPTTVNYNHTTTLTATTNYGYDFDGWYVGDTSVSSNRVSTDKNYVPTITQAITYTAYFKIKSYTVTATTWTDDATHGQGGTVSPTSKSVQYKSTTKLTATTKDGYTFIGWYDSADKKVGSNLSYTTPEVTKAVTYTAKFTINTYEVSTSKNIAAAGTVSGAGTYKFNTSVTISADTNYGYTFLGWYDENDKKVGTTSYTFNVPAKNVSYAAKWSINNYTITYIISTDERGATDGLVGGTLNPTEGNHTYQYLTNVNPVASTNKGYEFLGWYEGATKVSEDLSYPFQVTEDRTLTAKWQRSAVSNTFTDADGNDQSKLTYAPNTDTETVPVQMPDPKELTGFVFVGWIDNETGDTYRTRYVEYGDTTTYYSLYVRAVQNTITTGGEIKLNFFLGYKTALSTNPDITVSIEEVGVADSKITQRSDDVISTTVGGIKTYRFQVMQAPKDYLIEMRLRVLVGNEEIAPVNSLGVESWENYSLATYLSKVDEAASNMENEDPNKEIYADYARNMHVYCESARQYFDGSVTDITAQNGVSEEALKEVQDLKTEAFNPYTVKVTGTKPDGIRLMGFTAMVELGTRIRFNFQTYEGTYTFNWIDEEGNRTPAEVVKRYNSAGDCYFYIDTPEIAAKDLDKVFTLELIEDSTGETMTFKYSALTYAQMAVQTAERAGDKATTEQLKLAAFAKSLLAYQQTADAYANRNS